MIRQAEVIPPFKFKKIFAGQDNLIGNRSEQPWGRRRCLKIRKGGKRKSIAKKGKINKRTKLKAKNTHRIAFIFSFIGPPSFCFFLNFGAAGYIINDIFDCLCFADIFVRNL